MESLVRFMRREDRQNAWASLIEIQKGGGEQPLFCVSTPNVHALGYIFLARHLDSSQPVYGLQAQYPEDLQGEHSQIVVEELAVEYLAAMRTLQPRGPYQLVGMCRGAHIAHEMARLLEADGERVELLGILDTWVLENTYNRFLYLTYYARRLQALWQMSFQARNKLIAAKLRSLRGRSNSEGQAETFLRNPLAAYWPGAEYKPKLISGRLAVFRARRQPLDRIRDRALGWQRLTTGEVEVFSVPGLHGTLLREPHVKVLAKALQSRLQSGTNNGSKP